MNLPTPLSASEIEEALARLPGWTGGEPGLERRLVFEDFRGAMQFMAACVEGIERLNHHPVWSNKFNVVEVHLDTFDIGHRVTPLDLELARHLEDVLRERGAELGWVADE